MRYHCATPAHALNIVNKRAFYAGKDTRRWLMCQTIAGSRIFLPAAKIPHLNRIDHCYKVQAKDLADTGSEYRLWSSFFPTPHNPPEGNAPNFHFLASYSHGPFLRATARDDATSMRVAAEFSRRLTSPAIHYRICIG